MWSLIRSLKGTLSQVCEEMRLERGLRSPQTSIAADAAVFAHADLFLLEYSWITGDTTEISPETQQQVSNRIEEIKSNLSTDGDAAARLQEATKGIAELNERFQRHSNDLAPNHLPFDSSLDSQEEIQEGPGECFQLLFKALDRLLPCCDRNHHARLRLARFAKQFDDKSRFFCDLYLSSRYDWRPCRWLEAKFTMEKVCSIDNRELDCKLIQESEDENKAMDLLVVGGGDVASIRRGQCCHLRSLADPTVALGELLDKNHLKCEFKTDINGFVLSDRAVLCLDLALSLLHLSHGEWRQVKWSVDSIFFLKNPETQKLQDKTPYLSWRLQVDSSPKEDELTTCNPQLLDFARLLMEIRTGERFIPSPTEPRKELWRTLLKFAEERPRYESDLRMAIEACIGQAGKEAAQDRSSTRTMQVYIFTKIVQALESYLYMVKSPTLPELPPSTTHPAKATVPNGARMAESIYDGHVYEKPEDPSAARYAMKFLSEMDRFTQNHIQGLPASKHQKIKIAVIDSGVSRKRPRIRGAIKSGKIKKCRNFLTTNQEDWHDEVGHGTIVSRLLMQVAPNAEIYVAKVADKQYNEKEKLHCIAQAIQWAVQVWQVDIITMSLALSESHPEIEENLKQALDPSYEGATRKIVFAAAGNGGGNEELAWPACLPGVIGVHATDGFGNSTRYNATPQTNNNFATLGHEIEISWKNNEKTYVSGSSFATPIAAGIAANVLEFARYNLELTNDQKKRLCSGGCMKRIFREMAEDRNGYAYVQPWTLWERGNGKTVDIRRILQDIISEY